MPLPDYWLSRPTIELDAAVKRYFNQLYDESNGNAQPIEYKLSIPKWQFLCYLAEHRDIVLHGSGNARITRFEPRQPNDISAFGNQNAVYAAADGIWALFYAILDRERYPLSLNNSCIKVISPDNKQGSWRYFFSISKQFLAQRPFRDGTVYILPRATFTEEPPMHVGDLEIHSAQLASLSPVEPLTRLTVTPDDFPFLNQIRGHDDARLAEYAQALQTGAPLPED